jgi:RNA polymerase sigma-70 factor (ECF subfamily)
MESALSSICDMNSSTRDEAPLGNGVRFETLFASYQRPLLNYLYRLVGDSARAEELCQETFTRAYRARRSLEQVQNARAWLYRIATNAARDHLRRRRLLAWLPLFDDDPVLSVEDPEADASETQAVRSALLKLGPDLRAPLVLYTCQELSTQEIAAILGISREAVKQRLVRARLRFKQVYEGGVTSEAEK